MTHVLTVAAREVRERILVLWTAAAVAMLPFLAQLLPGMQRWPKQDLIAGSAGILAIAVALGLALVMGGTFVVRDLADRRLSFYFSKPLPASSLWFGKVLGAIVLAGLSFAIISVPALIVAPNGWRATWDAPPLTVASLVLSLSVIFILVSHAAGTMFRARSVVLIADLILLVLCSAASWALIQSFLAESAYGVVRLIGIVLASAVLVGLAGAGAWQLSRGRTDVKRSHLELSKFLWSAIVAGVVLAGLYAVWVRSAGVTDLIRPHFEQNAAGDYAVVAGAARGRAGYFPYFLVNLGTGKSNRFPPAASFTTNGRAAFGITQTSSMTSITGQLVVQRLGRDAKPVTMPVTLNGGGSAVLSNDLSRAAVLHGPLVAVYRIDDGRLLASVRLPEPGNGSYVRAFFPSQDVLRILLVRGGSNTNPGSPNTLRILELDIPHRRLTTTGEWHATGRRIALSANADGTALIARRIDATDGPRVLILDGRTATPRLSLDTAGSVRALSDGRFVSFGREGKVRSLSIFSREGALQREIPVNGDEWGYVAGEAGRGKLVVVTRRSDAWLEEHPGRGYQAIVVDIDAGAIVRREADSYIPPSWSWTDPRSENPNTSGDYLLTDANGAVWRWNALSGAKKKL